MGETGTAILISALLVGGFSSVLIALAFTNRHPQNEASNNKKAA